MAALKKPGVMSHNRWRKFGREGTIDRAIIGFWEMNNCVLRSYRALMARSDQSTSVQ
jgi:hypothetical protein